MLYLQKSSKFTISVGNMNTFLALFLISKSTDDIAKCKKALVDVDSYPEYEEDYSLGKMEYEDFFLGVYS